MSRLTLQDWIKQMESSVGADELANYMFREEIAKGIVKPVSPEVINERKQRVEWLKELQHYKDLEEQGRLIEQKHGYWKRKTKEYEYYRTYWYECSVCGEKPLHKNDGIHYHFTDYCPHCGAKMDEVEND